MKKRGHWKADASVARYEKAALVLSSWSGLTAEQQRTTSAAAAQLSTFFERYGNICGERINSSSRSLVMVFHQLHDMGMGKSSIAAGQEQRAVAAGPLWQ